MNILSRNEIIERALRRIGEYSINNRAPRERAVSEAAFWLDMVMAHEAARMRMWWLVDDTKTFDLAEATSEYDLTAAIGTSSLPRGLQFIISASLYDKDTGKKVCNLDLWRRENWENRVELAGDADAQPSAIYVNRDYKPTAFVWPAPPAGKNYEVHIVGQSYSDDFVHAQPTAKSLKMRASWNLWIVTALAAELGSGAIRRLPADEVKEMRETATKLRNEIEAADTDEHMGDPGRVAYWNGID